MYFNLSSIGSSENRCVLLGGEPVPSSICRAPPGLATPDGCRGTEDGPWPESAQVRLQREPRLLDSGSVSSRQGPVARKAPPASVLGHLFSLISNHTLPVHYAPIRPFCSSDPQSLFLPPGSLCLPSLHLVAHSSHRSMHLQLLLFILMWAQKHLPQGPSLTSSSPPPPRKALPLFVIFMSLTITRKFLVYLFVYLLRISSVKCKF